MKKHLYIYNNHTEFENNIPTPLIWVACDVDHMHYESDEILPYDAEIEYIQSNGNQWLELPIMPNENTDAIEFTFRRTESTNQQRFCSSANYDASTTSLIFNIYVNGSGRLAYHNGSWTAVSSSNNTAIGVVDHTIKLDYLNKKVTFDFTEFNMSLNSPRIATTNLEIIRQWGGNAVYKGRLYNVKYWRNGVLMYDLQPVRKDGVGYMFDKVNRDMYSNQGTGNFTLGHDKLTNISDFTQLDYIQNNTFTATSPFIDIKLSSDGSINPINIQMIVKWNTIDSGKRQLFGSSYNPWFGCDGGIYKSHTGNMNLPVPSTVNYDTVNMATHSSKPSNVGTITLFKAVSPLSKAYIETNYNCSCKLKSFKVWSNNILIRDFVPVKHPANIYGMFDRANNKFYSSANAGNFTGGFDS